MFPSIHNLGREEGLLIALLTLLQAGGVGKGLLPGHWVLLSQSADSEHCFYLISVVFKLRDMKQSILMVPFWLQQKMKKPCCLLASYFCNRISIFCYQIKIASPPQPHVTHYHWSYFVRISPHLSLTQGHRKDVRDNDGVRFGEVVSLRNGMSRCVVHLPW